MGSHGLAFARKWRHGRKSAVKVRVVVLATAVCGIAACSPEDRQRIAAPVTTVGRAAGTVSAVDAGAPATQATATVTLAATATSSTTAPSATATAAIAATQTSPTVPPTTSQAVPPATDVGYDLTVEPTCTISESLRFGDAGADVRCLQVRLDQVTGGADVIVDGAFGSNTDDYVRLFQASNGLAVDGLVGPQTAGLLGIWDTAPPPVPAVQPAIAPTDVYYENCDAVRAAGADPISRGEPGYASHLDRDGDGVGCE